MKTFSHLWCGVHAATSICTLCFVAGLLLIPGCSEKNAVAPSSASGAKLLIKGSNTIGEELAPRLIAEYKKQNPAAQVEMESKATGYGIAALLAGQCEIAAASRTPIQEELGLAKERGIELTGYPIGSYSVAVIVNGASPVQNLTKDQVRDVFTGTVQNWKDLGGPDAPIHVCGRDPISGTHLGFREIAMENKHYASGMKTFTNYSAIVDAVSHDPNAIGYCSVDLASKQGVKAVSIDGSAATAASVKDGKYPYTRILRFYTNKAREGGAPANFIQFVQSPKGQQVVAESGNIPKS